jgi:TonB family protein
VTSLRALAISLAVHAVVIAAVVALAPRALPPAAQPVEVEVHRTTRVALLGRASSLRSESPAAVAPVVARNRGPMRRQPLSVEPEVAAGESTAAEVASSPSAGGDGADGDGLAGVLAHSTDALGGDPRAAVEAEALAREAVKPPARPDLSPLVRKLQAAAARCYPEGARRFRQSGVATVEFCLDAQGALLRSHVLGSSGSALLDDAATQCVVPGALPAGAAIGQGCFTLPVRFGGAR